MIRDPHYRKVVQALGERLDPDLFERCMADALRDDMPTLVPISGGTDAGMDGAVAQGEGPALPLICTTAKDVIGNLTKNLSSYLSDGGRRRQAVLVTSQELTPQRRRNLEKRADDKGFELLQIYDRHAVADRLYGNSRRCRELLDLTGSPPALSAVPRTRRPLLGGELVGRQKDLAWLRETRDDLLLVGPPGSGKTFLLGKLAAEGRGLFLSSSDLTEVANAIREQHPPAIFVDDAHVNPELVVELIRLRQEIGAEFSIAATAWTGTEGQVTEALQLTAGHIRELELLSRDEIVEVINGCGVQGPVELVREIVNQAEGRPGLAVSLAYLCLRGGIEEVIRGDALTRTTMADFGKLVGEEANQVLAAFAVGGDGGMRPSTVASVLEIPRYKLRTIVTKLASGGVIDQVRHSWILTEPRHRSDPGGETPLVVRPLSLRYALVRDVFFDCINPPPIEELLGNVPEEAEAASTLVRTAGFGAAIPTGMLRDFLERVESNAPWIEYAHLGSAEAEWLLETHPELVAELADPALKNAPAAAIPKLLDLATRDPRAQNPFPDHPLRRLDSWVQQAAPGTGRAVERRRLLLESLATWSPESRNPAIVGNVLEMVLSPAFNDMSADPGSGRNITMRRGLLNADELSRLQSLWPRVTELLRTLPTPPWSSLFKVVHNWTYPSLHGPEPPEWVASEMRGFADSMLEDILDISGGHSGVAHKAKKAAEKLDSDITVMLDAEFEILFPYEDLRADVVEEQRRQAVAVRELAESWSTSNPADAAARISELDKLAADVDHVYPTWTPTLCEEIARRTEDATTWAGSLLDVGSLADLIAPFLLAAASNDERHWVELATRCLKRPEVSGAAIHAALITAGTPQNLLTEAIDKARWFIGVVEGACRQGRVPPETRRRLLVHEEPTVAAAAAIGEWYADTRGNVGTGVREAWEQAVLRAPTSQRMLSNILECEPELARDWLIKRVEAEDTIADVNAEPALGSAVSALDQGQRLCILRSVPEHYGHISLVTALVGEDVELYRRFLDSGELNRVHLWPLAGKPEGTWIEKAELALDAGFSPEDIAAAVYGGGWSWSGNESDMWKAWVDRFRRLETHEHEGIRAVGTTGASRAESSRERSLESERLEEIYGSL